MKTLRALTAIAGLLATAASYAAAKLEIGSKAPELKVAKWVKGKEIKSFRPGNVYVVEFWATWCGPCKSSIPHLTELAKKYQGKVQFTGVSVWEAQNSPTDTSYMKSVEAFVKEMGPKMDYNIAVDGPDKFMAENWMRASGENGIPAAFIVDRQGEIAWIGHPMADLDTTLDKVLNNRWDKRAFAASRAAEQAKADQINKSFAEIRTAIKAKNWTLAQEKAAQFKKTNPEYASSVDSSIVMGALVADEKTGYQLAREYGNGSLAKDVMALNQIAWFIVDDASKLKQPDFALALELSQRSIDAGGDKMPEILDTYALALFKNGQVTEAIAAGEKAVALMNSSTEKYPDAMRKEIMDRLAMYKAKKG